MFRKIFRFGEQSLNQIFTYLFLVGSMIIIYGGVLYSRGIYLGNTFMKEIEHFDGTWYSYTYEEVNNLHLAVLIFIVSTVLFILFWRILCELLYIIFNKIQGNNASE
jgi:uncharacterized membrane protein